LVLTFCTFIVVTTEMAPIGLLPAIGADLGIDEGRTGMLVSIYALLVVALAVPLTSVLRRLPGKWVLLATMGGYLASNVVFALAPGFATLAVARMIGGATHAVFFSVSIGYATRLVAPTHMGRALALVSSGTSAGLVIGSPIATAIGTALEWQSAAVFLAVLAAVAAVLILWRLPDVAPPARGSGSERRGSRKHAVAAIGANGLSYLGQFVLYTYVAVVLLRAGAQEEWLAVVLFVFGIFGVLAIFVDRPQLDRPPRPTTLVILGVVAASMLALGVLPATLPVVVVLGIIWNAAYGPVPSVFQSAAVRTRAFSPEVTGAWVNATSNLGIAVGSVVGGVLLDRYGTHALALVAGAFVALALALVIAVPKAFAPDDPLAAH